MKQNRNFPVLFLLLLLLMLCTMLVLSSVSVEARKNHIKKSKAHMHQKKHSGENGKKDPGIANPPSPAPASTPSQPSVFNVMSFGAKGNGVSDDSKAIIAAWKAACKVPGATLQIPSGFKFLIKPITLQGPCMPFLVFQIDGTLLAPPKIGTWPKSSLFQWLNFKWLQNFTIQGFGTADGQGSNWWATSQLAYIQKRSKHIPDMKPTALRFYASSNVTVRDIKIMNSPLCHLKFDNSQGVKVNNITIFAPENSPNTDGIHLQNTRDVEIQHSNIGSEIVLATGDDCVSIQTGCSNIHVHDLNCGPGHGISLGGLGKDKSVACVSDVIVKNISMEKTLYGARIKTWQGGIGSVKNVTFSDIQVSDVKVPIMIDQYYCDKHFCKNQTEAIAISEVKFNRIIGTYAAQPIHLACSNEIPCTKVDLFDVQLKPSGGYRGFQQGLCWNSYGKSQGPLVPSSMDYCLRNGDDSSGRLARSHEHNC